MSHDATPKRARPSYSRPTKYPAALPRTMTATAQREAVDAIREARDLTLGDTMRALISDGLVLDAALAEPGLRADIERMAREGGVTVADAIGTMLDFAVRESRRRLERNAKIAHEIGAGLGEMGFMVDGVTVGGLDLEARL